MKYLLPAALAISTALCPMALYAKEKKDVIGKLEVTLGGISNGGVIPAKYAFCKPDGRGKTRDGDNLNPEISWKGAPEGTKSFALIMVDKDVPADFRDANKDKVEIDAKAPRQNFYHWTVIDIPPTLLSIPEGKASNGMVKGGKPVGKVEFGTTGRNDYSKFMPGSYGGYDGPCPPWNDQRVHNYTFTVYALKVPSITMPEDFDARGIEAALAGKILAKGEVVATYTNHPDLFGGGL